MISTSELAVKWQLSPRYIRDEIERGNLNALRLGSGKGILMIIQDDKLKAWESNPKRASRKKKETLA